METSYILHHLGEDDLPLNAVSPPVFQTSNFCFPDFDSFNRALTSEDESCLYTRGNNPTVLLVEAKLAALEHGESAKLVASGAAAISHSVMAFLASGDHVVCVRDCYSWTKTLLSSYLPRFGISATFVDGRDPAEIEAALKPETKIIYLESPTTFTFRLQDLAAVARIARARGVRTVIDNTWATPIFCNPIDFGIDIVIHSASKYLGGHSDLVAGVIVGSKNDIDLIRRQEFLQLGTVPDPSMAWLLLRGMRSLGVRMPVHFANAGAVARALAAHPAVERVNYPFLADYPDRALALAQMRGGSGLLSFNLKTRDLGAVRRFTDSLRYFKRAVSWGGYESLVCPDAARYAIQAEPSGGGGEEPAGIPPDRIGLVRVHVGLEDPASLVDDLVRGLAAM